jgi:SAM-dependent methyltransferase
MTKNVEKMAAIDAALPQDVVAHFTARAPSYDRSSHWCGDPEIMQAAIRMATPNPRERMLDVACGTGLMAKAFRSLVGEIVGVDLTPAMAEQAEHVLDDLVLGAAEAMPFRDGEFDLTVCRQGLQFMDAERAVAEMIRVTRPSGRVLLINLCAYGDDDRDVFFEILRLRNPARRNFFLSQDLEELLRRGGCRDVRLESFMSDEDVDIWSGNGAIGEANRERIRELYRQASPVFRRHHQLRILPDGRLVDRMLFVLAVGRC